jgi:hypothetical protein
MNGLWPAAVELPTMSQLAIRVEQEKVRGADCPKGLGRTLRLVKQIGKCESAALGKSGHFLRSVFRKCIHVIGTDRNRGQTPRPVFGSERDKAIEQMLDERTVVAQERDQQAWRNTKISKRVYAPARIRELEIWCSGSQVQH